MQWKSSLSCPVLNPTLEAEQLPGSILRAQADDGELYAMLWGEGTQEAPYAFTICFVPPVPEGADPPDSRFPTLEEAHSAACHLLPEGVLYALNPPLLAQEPDDIPEARGNVALSFLQIGVQEHSHAAQRSRILDPRTAKKGIVHV